MKVWFYHNSPWPFRRPEISFPFPGAKFDRELGPEVYGGYVALYRQADELGFDGLCFTEHHYTKIGCVPSPNLMAAAVASQTSNGRASVAQTGVIGTAFNQGFKCRLYDAFPAERVNLT
jgi:hypothetical protein